MSKNFSLPVIALSLPIIIGFTGCSSNATDNTSITPSAKSTSSSAKQTPTTAKPTPKVTKATSGTGTALSAAESLTVKGRAPKTGYDRDQYGPSWKDMDHNGCDTRNDILKRDLEDITYKSGSKCVIATGTLNPDPYTGKVIVWKRGQDTSSAIQIDHIIALSDSWQKGAQQWSVAKRETFANDPLNLIAADGPANMSKGDGDTATWLPPYKPEWCAYVADQVAVKKKYGLWVTEAEKNKMVEVLQTCPNQPLPTGGLPVPE